MITLAAEPLRGGLAGRCSHINSVSATLGQHQLALLGPRHARVVRGRMRQGPLKQRVNAVDPRLGGVFVMASGISVGVTEHWHGSGKEGRR
jgi:hypothetical protein